MFSSRIFLFLSAILLLGLEMSASDNNVVITDMTETYSLKADKSGGSAR